MTILEFPPIETADETGLLALGGDLEVGSLLLAYKSGIFPWPLDSRTLAWFAPPERAILNFNDLHLAQSFKRFLKKSHYLCKYNQNFSNVIEGCAKAKNRKGQKGTWITPAMINAYINFHKAGYAHSVECYDDNNRIIGGIYGVRIGNYFAAESMFYSEPNASKLALYFLVTKLRAEGLTWLDAQVMNPFLEKLGFTEIPRKSFMEKLASSIS